MQRPSPQVAFGLLLLIILPNGAQTSAQEGKIVQQAELEAWTESIKKDVEELRGQRFKRPVAVSTANLQQFIGYVKERMEKDTSAEDLEAQELVAKMLGVIPPEMSLLDTYMGMIESQVGGFYDPSTESFCLMEQYGGDLARIVLAHELTHALDDQYYDIDGTLAKIVKNADASMAYHAVVEGSGIHTQNAWIKAHVAELDMKQLAAVGDLGTAGLEQAPPYLWKPLVGSYNLGASFLVRSDSMLAGQTKSATASDQHVAFRRPPLSSEQVMHPEKYWDPDQRDDPIPVAFALDKLPVGWEVLAEDTLGELGLGFVVEPLEKRKGLTSAFQLMTTKYTYPASEGWGGDRYLLLGRGPSRVLLLQTVWDSEDDRAEFSSALDSLKGHMVGQLTQIAAQSPAASAGTQQPSISKMVSDGRSLTLQLGFHVSPEDFGSILGALKP